MRDGGSASFDRAAKASGDQLVTWLAVVSFAKTALADVASKAEQIRALGWKEYARADPWAVKYAKDCARGEPDAEAELREVMAECWVDGAEIESLISRTPADP